MEACKQIELKMQIQALNRKRKTNIAEKQKRAPKSKKRVKAKNNAEKQKTAPKSKK
jgi:hypothetical protein